MRIGLDLDGVICEREITRTPEECVDAERSELPVPSHEHEIYIVSSRTENMERETRRWLAENGIDYKELILCDTDSFEGLSKGEIDGKQASFKAGAVNELELELDVYVEDRPDVREHLRGRCPDCIVQSPSEARKAWRLSVYEADQKRR